MQDVEPKSPSAEDPSLDLIEQTDNGLRPEDGDQTVNGLPLEDFSDEELIALAEEIAEEVPDE